MPRFVLLQHDHPFLHWDFMLEVGTVLRTWRLLDYPAAGQTSRAEALGDHRLTYLDYEGPVSGGRGAVERCDTGTYEAVEMVEDQCVVRLHGRRLCGLATLQRTTSDAWSFQYGDACGS